MSSALTADRPAFSGNFITLTGKDGQFLFSGKPDSSWHTAPSMRMTKQDRANLERFGCTFKRGISYLDWHGKDLKKASTADICASLRTVETEAGSMVFLAFEISAVRSLPSYFYFPFDLKNEASRQFLTNFTQTGKIAFCFVGGKQPIKRTHQLTPDLLSHTTDLYVEAVQNLAKDGGVYDFDRAVQDAERWIRIPLFFERLLPTDVLAEVSRRIEVEVQLAPKELRETAARIVREAMEALKPHYENNRKAMLQLLRSARLGLLLLLDLDRLFHGNSAGLGKLLAEAIAANSSSEDLENLDALLKIIVSLTTMFPFQAEPGPKAAAIVPNVPAELVDIFQSMAVARKIGLKSTRNFFGLLGFQVGGTPGRPPKDYSREYELKASKSWTEVARQSLSENAEIREEFGGRDFESLSFEERENLKNRIREGVRSYAERTGKPFPIEPDKLKDDPDRPAGN